MYNILNRFTENARVALSQARLESVRLHHEYIGTDHFLFALLHERVGFVPVLRRMKVPTGRVRKELEKIVKPGPAEWKSPSQIPLTPRANRVIEYAAVFADELRHRDVDVGHLFYSCAVEKEGMGGYVLHAAGADVDSIRPRLIRYFETLNLPVIESDSSSASLQSTPPPLETLLLSFNLASRHAFPQVTNTELDAFSLAEYALFRAGVDVVTTRAGIYCKVKDEGRVTPEELLTDGGIALSSMETPLRILTYKKK